MPQLCWLHGESSDMTRETERLKNQMQQVLVLHILLSTGLALNCCSQRCDTPMFDEDSLAEMSLFFEKFVK